MSPKVSHIITAKTDAFTLPEVVVSMLLMAILITVGTSAYIIISRQSQSIFRKNSFYADYYITKKALERDVEQSFIMTTSDENKVFRLQQTETPGAGDVFYMIDTGYIVRKKGAFLDTLLPGGVINIVEKLNDSLPLIRLLTIKHHYNNKPFFTYLQKRYSAEQVLRTQVISNHSP